LRLPRPTLPAGGWHGKSQDGPRRSLSDRKNAIYRGRFIHEVETLVYDLLAWRSKCAGEDSSQDYRKRKSRSVFQEGLMNKVEQAGYKNRLLELRKRLMHEVNTAEESLREDVVATGDISTVPTHPADHAAEGVDAEVAIAQNEELLLEQVEAALERIEVGTFGTCQECGQEINKERLDAIVYTPYCICCARRQSPAETEPPVRSEPRR
jgi:DnaK suppressor protein